MLDRQTNLAVPIEAINLDLECSAPAAVARSHKQPSRHVNLTDKALASLKQTGARYEVWDTKHHAFGVRVGPTGKKSFIHVYRFNGRRRRVTLGQYPKMSMADAGVAYAAARQKLALGLDPGVAVVEQRRQLLQMPTIRELGEEYLEKHCRLNKRSWIEDQRIFDHDIEPVWGDRKVSSITRADVNALLDDIAARAPVQANRTFAFFRSMFRFAEGRDYIVASPCHGVKKRTKEHSRDRVLETSEITELLRGLERPGVSPIVRLAVRFVLLTAQRIGEVVNAEWTEFDLENGVWTIPGTKVKNGKPHRVPLSTQALDILRLVKAKAGTHKSGEPRRWVFPSPHGNQPLTTRSLDRALRRLRLAGHVPDFRPHDLRRTAATHMTRLGVSRLTVHKLLNHSDRSVTAIYDRYDYDEEKRKAVALWGREIAPIAA